MRSIRLMVATLLSAAISVAMKQLPLTIQGEEITDVSDGKTTEPPLPLLLLTANQVISRGGIAIDVLPLPRTVLSRRDCSEWIA